MRIHSASADVLPPLHMCLGQVSASSTSLLACGWPRGPNTLLIVHTTCVLATIQQQRYSVMLVALSGSDNTKPDAG